jgi:hypothetical protein
VQHYRKEANPSLSLLTWFPFAKKFIHYTGAQTGGAGLHFKEILVRILPFLIDLFQKRRMVPFCNHLINFKGWWLQRKPKQEMFGAPIDLKETIILSFILGGI